jgi:hypothetical protein
MSDERRPQSVSGAPDASAIDRELTALLSIEPSAEFAAGVRERIRDRRIAGNPRLTWWLGVAAAVAVITIAAFASRTGRTAEAPRAARTATDIVLPAVVASAPHRAPRAAQTPLQRRRDTQSPRRLVRASVIADGPRPAEVLVPRDQFRAIARLEQLIVNGELTEQNLPGNGSAVAGNEIRPAPLAIPPLVVPPIDAAAVSDGSAPRSVR